MDSVEQFEFLKNYYNILKSKNAQNIGPRFLDQVKQLTRSGEIDAKVFTIISSCIAIGQEIGKDISSEDLELMKDFISIGVEMKEEQTASKLAQQLASTQPVFRSKSTVSPDPCSSGYSGKTKSGC